MKRSIHTIALVVVAALIFNTRSQADDFDQFRNEQEQGVKNEKDSFQQYKADVTKQFDNYIVQQERMFREYSGLIGKKWGRKNVVTSSKKEYVSYDSNYSSRNSINFEEGKAKVEILLTEEEARNPKLVAEKLKNQLEKLAAGKGGTDPLEVRNSVTPEKNPILAEQILTNDGRVVTEKNVEQFADQYVQSDLISQEDVTGNDGIKRVLVGVQVPLIPNHVKQRAEDFREQVMKESDRFGIDRTLVFAIMHTESYFNPKARSSAPAYGLMQLVPKSGAREAYLFAYKRDAFITGEYLFIPNNNIELGTAYLTKLLTSDFGGIRNSKSRIYCTIAAYNTGPGNVAKSFTGNRNVNQALPQINAMTSDQVLEHLKRNLPFAETRGYVATVSERMGLYSQWSKE